MLVFVFTVPLSMFMTKKITGFTRPLFRKRSAKLGELNGFVEEMISGQKTLRAYSQEENTIKKLDKQNDETVDAYYRADYYGSMVGPSVNFVNNLSLSLVSFFGATAVFGRVNLYRQHFELCTVLPQVQRADQRNREHHRRIAVGVFGGGARVPLTG